MNILLLMAGGSEKFQNSGYIYPKNLIEVAGKPIVEHVIENLRCLDTADNHFIFVVNDEEDLRYHTGSIIKLLLPDAEVLKISGKTSGAVCTALMAIDFIHKDEPLLIINGDICGNFQIQGALESFKNKNLDGGVIVFEGVHPRWSYVKCDDDGFVVEAAEKRPISKLATIGIYYFNCGKDFVDASMEMIKKDAHVDNNFFVCPSYNEMILRQKKIGIFEISRNSYFSFATPQGVSAYEEYLKAREGRRRSEDGD